MADNLEDAVAHHYGVSDLAQRVLAAIKAAGLDERRLRHEDLAAIDEFHIGGRAATAHLMAKLPLGATSHVLDVGCGIGGATRYVAATTGARVTGIDLTPEFVDVARMLAERTGLADRIDYRVASALQMPFAPATFDAALTLHVAMNIKDRAGLYREVARVLKPGAPFGIYDVMKGAAEGPTYPVPWADTSATSHLTTPQETETLLAAAEFDVIETEDRRDYGIAFFRERLAAAAAASGPPALGLHLLIGQDMRDKFRNLLAGLEQGCVTPVVMIARRRP